MKIDQKRSKYQKSILGRLGASWGCLKSGAGCISRSGWASWGVLEASLFWLASGCYFGSEKASWEVFGASLGRLGGVLGASWLVLGRLGSVLGASWGRLGASWRRLVGVLGPSWAILGDLGPSWRHLGPSWRRLGGVLGRKPIEIRRGWWRCWRSWRMRVGLSKGRSRPFLSTRLDHALAPCLPAGAGGLPTPAAITAGPLFFRLAFFESEFVEAGFFRK